MFEHLANFILARRFLVAFVLGLVFFALGSGGTKLNADFNVESFFQENNHEAYQHYVEQWGRDDAGIFIVVTGEQESLLSPPQFSVISDLATQLRKDPNIARVVALSDFVRIVSKDSSLVLETIEDTIPADFDTNPESREAWQKSILEDPVLVPNLLSKTGKTGSLLVELTGSTVDLNALIPKLKGVRETLESFNGKEGLHFADSGMISLRADFFEAIIADQVFILPIVSLLMLLMLGITFRKLHGALIPFLAAIVPTTMLFGIMGHFGQPIDMVNNTLTTLLPAIAIADAIHLLSRFHEEARKLAAPGELLTKAQRKLAVARSLKELGSACFLTSLTTTVGFGSLYLAEMSVLKTFGLYASIGIILSYGTVLFVIPLLLSITKGQPTPAKEDVKGEGHPVITSIANFSINRPILVMLGTAVITGIFIFYSTKVVVDNRLTNLLFDGHSAADSTAIVDQELGGIVSYEVDFKAKEPLLKNPKFLQALRECEKWIETNPDVRSVVSPATFISQSAESFTGESKIPDDAGLIAQLYLLLDGYEELEQVLDYDFTRARMAIRARDGGAIVFAAYEAKLQDHLDQAFKEFEVDVEITGAAVMAYRGVNNITYDLRRGLIGAFLIVALIIALEFKSLFMVLISLVANGIPLIIGYGSLGLFNWHLEPTTGLIFTVGLGIAVDDTIHLLARFFEEQKRGRSPDDALRVAVAQCGKAVFLTSCLLVVALGMNLISSFAYVRAVGASGSAIIIAALLCDLFTLPALLKLSARFLPKIQPSGE